MSQSVKNNADLIRALIRMSNKRRKHFIRFADKELIASICECALNTLKGNVPLKGPQKRTLSRHKRILRRLVQPKCNWKKKRKLLIQKGGSLPPALLGPVIGIVLSSLIKS